MMSFQMSGIWMSLSNLKEVNKLEISSCTEREKKNKLYGRFMANWNEIEDYVKEHKCQSHLAICNDALFDSAISNGIYGFPHSHTAYSKSFWRSCASLYNIGSNDLIFLYRTKEQGINLGNREVHGPFRIAIDEGGPMIYYDRDSHDYEIRLPNENHTDCKVRFLFSFLSTQVDSMNDNFALVEKLEVQSIWGFRHPAVMNIGAATKKSVVAMTYRQTLEMIRLFIEHGAHRHTLELPTPLAERVNHYKSLDGEFQFPFDDEFILSADKKDEAVYYAYFIRALRHPDCIFRDDLIYDLEKINSSFLLQMGGVNTIAEVLVNAQLNPIVTVHLQQELDVITTNLDDSVLMVYEFKKGKVDQAALSQTISYLRLLSIRFPDKQVFGNIIGTKVESGMTVPNSHKGSVKLVKMRTQTNPNRIRFEEVKDKE